MSPTLAARLAAKEAARRAVQDKFQVRMARQGAGSQRKGDR